MQRVDYDERLHNVYVEGRRMLPEARHTWMRAFAGHLPGRRPLTWLDLGSGSGRMTPSLVSAFGGPAFGVEPSEKMRARAIAHATHRDVTYVAGSAEHIPLPDASCDAALLFFAWHHVLDHRAGAQELLRVVKPGGKLFVQANLSDKMPDPWWFRVVPEWRAVDTAQFRSEAEVMSDFTGAGWTLASHDEVTWLRSASLVEDYDKLKLRSVSVFEHMGDELIETGFARIEAALPFLPTGPQFETSDMLVFARSCSLPA